MKQAIKKNHQTKCITRSFLLFLTCTTLCVSAQEKKLAYNIKRNGDIVGNIQFVRSMKESKTIRNPVIFAINPLRTAV